MFGIGYHPADSTGRVAFVSIGEPICIGGVRIKRGYLIVGDEDGVVPTRRELAVGLELNLDGRQAPTAREGQWVRRVGHPRR